HRARRHLLGHGRVRPERRARRRLERPDARDPVADRRRAARERPRRQEPRAGLGARPHVLVTGAGGQVGLALRAHLPEATFLTRAALDMTDAAAVAEVLEGADLVV